MSMIKPYNSRLYTTDELIETGESFPSRDSLREAINQQVKEKEELTKGEIADRLGIPRILPRKALRDYVTNYTVYDVLLRLLSFEKKRGNLEIIEKDEGCCYRLKDKLPLTSDYKTLLEREYVRFLDKIGPCGIKMIEEKLGITYNNTHDLTKKLEKKGILIMIKGFSNNTKYDFFSHLFTKRGKGYLVLNPNNPNHLKKLTEALVACLPDEIPPWYSEHLDNQLNELRKNGLPGGVYSTVKKIYTERLIPHQLLFNQ